MQAPPWVTQWYVKLSKIWMSIESRASPQAVQGNKVWTGAVQVLQDGAGLICLVGNVQRFKGGLPLRLLGGRVSGSKVYITNKGERYMSVGVQAGDILFFYGQGWWEMFGSREKVRSSCMPNVLFPEKHVEERRRWTALGWGRWEWPGWERWGLAGDAAKCVGRGLDAVSDCPMQLLCRGLWQIWFLCQVCIGPCCTSH